MTKVNKLPILYSLSKKGVIIIWQIGSKGKEVITYYGQLNGKVKESSYEAVAKNIGKSNATTPEEQAVVEAEAAWDKRLKVKYYKTEAEAKKDKPIRPMSAHTYAGTKKEKLEYPVFIQPKLDGLRCLAKIDKGKVDLISRKGETWNITHIEEELSLIDEQIILDGEIYIHGILLQDITSYARSAVVDSKNYKEKSQTLQYHVYDIPFYEGGGHYSFKERAGFMNSFSKKYKHLKSIKFVTTKQVLEEGVQDFHNISIEMGYEGTIIRSQTGLYLWGYRSDDLLKKKDFSDTEFKVLNIIEGIGKMKGCSIMICQNDLNDETFECTIKCSLEQRAYYFNNQNKYIGRLLTVRFYGRTKKLIPKFPVGILFRDAKDLATK